MVNGRFLGIDFSGGAGPWKARCARPTVWIADVRDGALDGLSPVQRLEGEGPPFLRLAAMLKAGDYAAAAIDAPFSLPSRHVVKGHPGLIDAVARLPVAEDRPFPRGEQLLALARQAAALEGLKPVRSCEALWRSRGVNARSTLWAGPRGGAPFAAACMTLLGLARRPMWPWSKAAGFLAETFPAGQLWVWGLPHQRYGAAGDAEVRRGIVRAVGKRIELSRAQRALMVECTDALDAVLAAFGAIAAATGRVLDEPPPGWRSEGAIAVMEA